MRNNPAMVSLEAVAMEATKVATMVAVAAGMTVWLLVDGDETEVEDDEEAAAEAHRDTQLRATKVHAKAAAEAERVATAEAEHSD
jgi:hypothetical protein